MVDHKSRASLKRAPEGVQAMGSMYCEELRRIKVRALANQRTHSKKKDVNRDRIAQVSSANKMTKSYQSQNRETT